MIPNGPWYSGPHPAGPDRLGLQVVYFDTLEQAGVTWMCRQTKPR
jgi:hypothetical protein